MIGSTLFVNTPVRLEDSFEHILGWSGKAMTEAERRIRWATWLKISRNAGYADLSYEWATPEDCSDCIYKKGRGWCDKVGLPCTVNPISTFRTGMYGMACMGLAKILR